LIPAERMIFAHFGISLLAIEKRNDPRVRSSRGQDSDQVSPWMFGYPAFAMVGTSGTDGKRFWPVIASARSFPLLMCGTGRRAC